MAIYCLNLLIYITFYSVAPIVNIPVTDTRRTKMTFAQSDLSQFKMMAQRGFSLVPASGKKPTETGWTRWCREKRPFDPKDFVGRNAVTACGPASGIIVIDIDDVALFRQTMKQKRWKLAATFAVKTGKGYHLYYKYPDGERAYGSKSFKKQGFDIRGDGGCAVCPGSVHPDTKKLYRIVADRELSKIDLPFV